MATGSNLLLDNKRKTHAIDNRQEIFSQLDVVITMAFLISYILYLSARLNLGQFKKKDLVL